MFLTLEERLREAVRSHISTRYQLDVAVVVETPKKSDFGEVALPVSFALAKSLRQAPRKIAEEIVAELPPVEGIASLEVAGGGYINVRFDRATYAEGLRAVNSASASAAGGKIIVEHTNINPNKAAHIGHLRNAILGDTLVRMLRAIGRKVEVQNYIDNTGVQVADVVAAFHFLEHKTPADVQALVDDPHTRFDYYCWDLYAAGLATLRRQQRQPTLARADPQGHRRRPRRARRDRANHGGRDRQLPLRHHGADGC